MATVKWEKKGSVAIVSMCNGTNRQNPDFVADMNLCFDQILADKGTCAVVLTSTDEKNFSQGIDTDWLGQKMKSQDFDSIKSFLHGINGIFKRVLLMPLPVIAAINGHAFGNGAMLACACDFRFMKTDKGFFCFPEVDINIPFLPGMIGFVRKAMPEYKFNEMLLTGKRVGAQELADSHVIEKASRNLDELMTDALGFAAAFKKGREIFGELKKRKHNPIIHVMDTEDVARIDALNLFVQ